MNFQPKIEYRTLAPILLFVLASIPAISQIKSDYQVATITEVQVHHQEGNTASDTTSYDVFLKVGDTIYTVLYTPPLGEGTVKYAAGRNILVLVGKKTITYNDILGRPYEAPILNQKTAKEEKQSKQPPSAKPGL